MVIILSKTLEKKKGVSDVRSLDGERLLRELHTMSRGTTLFSCATVEADRWLDLRRGPSCQSGPSLESLWDVLPEPCHQSSHDWGREAGSAISSLIQDLTLGDGKQGGPRDANANPNPAPTAPPSKRQCRSLSFPDEFGGCRSSPWRPQGSRVWTTVEKRRCHSGGSVRGLGGMGFSGGHFPAMQRSSSFSLPSRSSNPADGALELPCFTQSLPSHPLFTASTVSPTSPPALHFHHHSLRSLSLSHEQISLLELHREEASEPASSPDSTPELGRRRAGQIAGVGTGGLSRSRSQPCVLNDKKIGMKRRRPEDAQEQRPSLDLAKMTQKLQTFQSLSYQSRLPPPPSLWSSSGQLDSDFTSVSDLRLDPRQEIKQDEEEEEEEDSSFEELDSDSACSMDSRPGSPVGDAVDADNCTLWKGDCGTQRDIFQLGGELDLDQIERN